ncbi:hypothetical protein WJ971_22140 [Achromobacter xylosoxidans]
MQAMAELGPALARVEEGWRDARRLLVSPFVRVGRLEPAIAALERLVQAYPARTDDRRLLASLLGRTEQWERAIAQADAAAAIAPDSAALQAARIQLRVQAGHIAQAADVARQTVTLAAGAPGDAHWWMLAFSRNGDAVEAAGIAMALQADDLPNARVATVAVRALLDDDRVEAAILLGNAALDAGHDAPALRASLGLAHLRRATDDDRKVHALAHFEAGLEAAPTDVRLLTLHGETCCARAATRTPWRRCARPWNWPPNWSRHAPCMRALRYTLQYGEAADQLLHLVEKSPDKQLWQRAAIGALCKRDASRKPKPCSSAMSGNAARRCRQRSSRRWNNWSRSWIPRPYRRRDWTGPGRCVAMPGLIARNGSGGRAGATWWITCCSIGSNAAKTASRKPCKCWANWTPANASSRRCWRLAGAWWWPRRTSAPCMPG